MGSNPISHPERILMTSNFITTSGDPNIDFLYKQNNAGKYEFYGFKGYDFIDDEGSVVIKCSNLQNIIDNLQHLQKEIINYNKMGS